MIGSLFTGYGGLDMAAQAAFGLPAAFVADIEPGPCKILAHHHPDVPNLGDVRSIDWAPWHGRIKVLTGGFPCQDVSLAGLRGGLRRGENRSGLWSEMHRAIVELGPLFVVIENVRGILSAEAYSDVEPCPWCMGDEQPVALRALGAVLGDLADAGYDARWCGLRASDVGACHGRFRVFILAEPSDAASGGLPVIPRGDVGEDRVIDEPGSAPIPRTAAGHTDSFDHQGCEAAGFAMQARSEAGPSVALLPTPTSSDCNGAGAHGDGGMDLRTALSSGGSEPQGVATRDFGPYQEAVRRHAAMLGRPAPDPTEPGPSGGRRLSPKFVEWMMCLPDGWVTGVPALSRRGQLRALGNGVVPAQAVAALRHMLAGAS